MQRRVIFLGLALFVAFTAFVLVAVGNAQNVNPVPAVPRASTATEHLGRLLFWDPILSGNKDTACGTCHHPDFAYADGRDLSRGSHAIGLGPARRDVSNGRIPIVRRNSPTVLNTAFNGIGENRRRRRGDDGAAVASIDPAR